jgi:putative aldouronate transport system permease protein
MTKNRVKKDFRSNWPIYLILLPVIIYFAIFAYVPMAGILMAFQNFTIKGGIWGSPWVGFKNFADFFGAYQFLRLLRNTFLISFYDLLLNFPAPIIFALLMNELRSVKFKRVIQTISYMPYFVSLVIICGIIIDFFSSNGAMTSVISFFGGPSGNLLGMEGMFRPIFVGTNLWQSIGFSSIIYMAALSGIDQELYEAAVLDGANRLRQTWHITLPGISPTIIILLILRLGSILNVSFEKVILLYSPAVYETADVISSFVYRKGLMEFNYGYSTAVGLFNSVISLIIIITTNAISRKVSETSLF